jgi:hypothetical protein
MRINADGDALYNFLDLDSENDNRRDANEGFDDDNNGVALNDYLARATLFVANGGNATYYDNSVDTDSNTIPDWLEDDDADGIYNYLDFNSAFYRDTDNDGLVDLVDVNSFGNAYATLATFPDFDTDGIPNIYDTEVILPLTWLNIKANIVGEYAKVIWTTATEYNVNHFEVWFSSDGYNYEKVGELSAKNASYNEYVFTHLKPVVGSCYYRVKQIDNDNTFTWSRVVVVSKEGIPIITVYPNPTSANLFVTSDNADIASLDVYNVNGQLLYSISGIAANFYTISVENYPSGMYFIDVTTTKGYKKVVKFSKQ